MPRRRFASILYQDVRSESLLWLCLLGRTHEHPSSVLWGLEMGCMAKTMRLQSRRKHYHETMVREDDQNLLVGRSGVDGGLGDLGHRADHVAGWR
jgi:hypothetical protein